MFGENKIYKNKKVQLSNGCNVSYIDEGRGDKTLVFIHGLATYGYCWGLNIAELKNKYRCIAIDLPGNGYSDGGDYKYGINFYSGCVYDFIQQLSLKDVVLVGHSMGGQIALNLAINQPDSSIKLVLCAPAGFEQFNIMERTMYKTSVNLFDFITNDEFNLRSTIQSSFYSSPKYASTMIKELVDLMNKQPTSQYRKMTEGCIDGMMNEPVYDNLSKVQQPTLVIFGDNDALIPNKLLHPTTTRYLAEQGTNQIPNARLEMIPNCGHFLQLEKPAIVNKLISEFLN